MSVAAMLKWSFASIFNSKRSLLTSVQFTSKQLAEQLASETVDYVY